MAYREEVINGVLHYMEKPSGKMVKFSDKMLMQRINDVESRMAELFHETEELRREVNKS